MATATTSVSVTERTEGRAPAVSAEEMEERFAVGPLEARLGPNWAAEARGRGMSAVEVGTLLRSLNRARAGGGLTARAADQLAVRAAGVHPAVIWGAQWWSSATCGGPKACVAADCCGAELTRDGDEVCD